MSEQTMVERVARAIEDLAVDGGGTPTEMALAALKAMREQEPTGAIADAMNDVSVDAGYFDLQVSLADCCRLFAAGIDAAISEAESR